jgi:hypothetical protein
LTNASSTLCRVSVVSTSALKLSVSAPPLTHCSGGEDRPGMGISANVWVFFTW